jgi:ankyrin repeat protein
VVVGTYVSSANKYGCAPFHYARLRGNLEVIKLLIDNFTNISTMDDYGYTSFHRSCNYGRLEVVKLLIYNGVDMSVLDRNGYTSLQFLHDEQLEKIKGK